MSDTRKSFYKASTEFTPETPFLDDIEKNDTLEIGQTIKDLSEGDLVKVTNNHYDFYIKGEVEEKTDAPNGEEFYKAILRFGTSRAELHVNWRDLPPNSDDTETPYTGLLLEPFDDTSPPVTDIEVV